MSDRVVGCDVLARWTHLDSAETRVTQETGRLPSNNDKVIYQACRAISRLRKASRAIVTVFVDMTAIELFKTDVDEFIATCLSEFQIDPKQLAVKIEASTIRVDWSASSKQIKKLKDIGVNICVSGIDTGFSNLNFLNGLTVDYLKLHQSFAHGIEKNPEQTSRCRHILERAQEIGAKVVFEGVNNVEAASALRKLNAKIVQGRFAGYPPSTVDDLIRELPEYIERKLSDQTVILDEKQLSLGEWKV
jgi:EAL domain-containing protein (putative c-di-GMP-specific phosphodiesterase class I)